MNFDSSGLEPPGEVEDTSASMQKEAAPTSAAATDGLDVAVASKDDWDALTKEKLSWEVISSLYPDDDIDDE